MAAWRHRALALTMLSKPRCDPSFVAPVCERYWLGLHRLGLHRLKHGRLGAANEDLCPLAGVVVSAV